MLNHIVVATDFSPRSDRAMRRASLLARQLDSTLTLVHVVDEDQPDHLLRSQIKTASLSLDETARTLRDYDRIETEARIVVGDAAQAILTIADEVDADLIVLGRHRRQWRDVFTGTTAERAVGRSRRPLLIAASVPAGPYSRALVALDLEEHSKPVARRVAEMGMLGADSITALHAYDAPARRLMLRSMTERETIERYVMSEALAAADAFGRSTEGSPLTTDRHMIEPITGSPARTIVEAAKEAEASLIIVGTSQRKGLERLIVGSVATDVLNDAERDVLVIPR